MQENIQELLANALMASGCKEVPLGDTRYRRLACTNGDGFFFVSRGGTIRMGRSVAKSRVLSDEVREYLLFKAATLPDPAEPPETPDVPEITEPPEAVEATEIPDGGPLVSFELMS